MGHIAPIHMTKKYEKLPKSDISHIDSYRFVAIFPQIALLYVRHDCRETREAAAGGGLEKKNKGLLHATK